MSHNATECPCGKRCYTYREARELINYAAKRAHHGRYNRIPKREYKCEECGMYHLTSGNHK